MTKTDLPTPEELRKLLDYDPATGSLTWLERPSEMFTAERYRNAWNARLAGKPAFTADKGNGYRSGGIFGGVYLAHRVAWALHTGAWPEADITHINGTRDDNRIENLRAVTRLENVRNTKRSKVNTSGVTGVGWRERDQIWNASITVDRKRLHLGNFRSFEEAVAARKAAEKRFGFHENHGRG